MISIILDFFLTFCFFINYIFFDAAYAGILIVLLCLLPQLKEKHKMPVLLCSLILIIFHIEDPELFVEGGLTVGISIFCLSFFLLAFKRMDLFLCTNISTLTYIILANETLALEKLAAKVPVILLCFNVFCVIKYFLRPVERDVNGFLILDRKHKRGKW